MTDYGWAGELLWVDLSSNQIDRVPTSDFDPQRYIGGVGLNTKVFWELGSPAVDAFDPDSPLIISVGPLTGVSGPFNRAEVGGIAPQAYPQELHATDRSTCRSRTGTWRSGTPTMCGAPTPSRRSRC
jgi:aldehyde:ferredoxin oxidoreductase